jgi:hypothetical protein
MASIAEERGAFEQLAGHLRNTAASGARALRVHRGTPAGSSLDRHLEHTLDRLALLYGRGTYENLSTEDITETAVNNELRLAAALEEPHAAAATGRARALVDAARRGMRLHVREPAPSVRLLRGVYVAPLSPELERSLSAREEPYLRWEDGAVLLLGEEELDGLRAASDEVNVLFLDADELLDLDFRDDRPALEAELASRQTAARSAPDRVGDSRDRYLLRLLDGQSIVLRNLRDRLAQEHPSAHAALLPILAEHRGLHEERLAAQPTAPQSAGPRAAAPEAAADPLGATIESERNLVAHARKWTAEPGDPAGLRERFRVVADAGTHLPDLEQHHTRKKPT